MSVVEALSFHSSSNKYFTPTYTVYVSHRETVNDLMAIFFNMRIH